MSFGATTAAAPFPSAKTWLPELLTLGFHDAPTEEWQGTCRGFLDLRQLPVDHFEMLRRPEVRHLLKRCSTLIPLNHLETVLDAVLGAAVRLHKAGTFVGCVRVGPLLVGQRGIGKSTMLLALTVPRVVHEMLEIKDSQPEGLGKGFDTSVRATVVLYSDIAGHSSRTTESFSDWMLTGLLDAEQTTGTPLFPELSDERQQLLAGWPTPAATLHDPCKAVRTVNALMLSLSLRVVCILDHAESVFRPDSFCHESYALWGEQLRSFCSLGTHAISIVLCASLQRARELFFPQQGAKAFGGVYGHATSDRANWNNTKFSSVSVSPPAWTAFSLGWYLLWHTGSKRRAIESAQTLDSQLAALPEEEYHQTSAYRRIPLAARVQAGMRRFLRIHGDVPRDLAYVAQQGGILKRRTNNTGQIDLSDESERVLGCMLELLAEKGVVAAFLSPAGQKKGLKLGDPSYLLTFAPKDLHVPLNDVKDRLLAHFGLMQASSGVGPPAWALDQIHAAVDQGVVQRDATAEDLQVVHLSSPVRIWNAYKSKVHPSIVDWFVYPGFRPLRELSVARALARLGNEAAQKEGFSQRTLKFRSALELRTPAKVLVAKPLATSTTVVAENEDTCAYPLAELRLILDDAPTQDDVQAAFPGATSWDDAMQWARSIPTFSKLEARMQARALAAYMAVHRMEPGLLRHILSLNQEGVWLKEAPDKAGGGLIGIFCNPNGPRWGYSILRVQVKTKERSTLASDCRPPAASGAVDLTVRGFTGCSAAQATKAKLDQQHKPVAKAILCAVLGARHGTRQDDDSPEQHFQEWVAAFAKDVMFADFISSAWLVTTYTPSKTSVGHLNRCGINLLDAWDLRHSWGALGEIDTAHGTLPFSSLVPPSAVANQAAVAREEESIGTGQASSAAPRVGGDKRWRNEQHSSSSNVQSAASDGKRPRRSARVAAAEAGTASRTVMLSAQASRDAEADGESYWKMEKLD